MSLLLAIETATEISSVALSDEGKILGSIKVDTHQSHSTYLADMTNYLLKYCNKKFSEINAIAISSGPGSYTGLRIGTSFSKGICYAQSIPLIGINTLTGLARNISSSLSEESLICPMIDARRMEVYSSVLTQKLNVIEDTTNVIVDEDAYKSHLDEKVVVFVGNAVEKCKPVLKEHKNAVFVENENTNAESIAKLAHLKYLAEDFEDLAYFEPFYLKEYKAGKPKKSIVG